MSWRALAAASALLLLANASLAGDAAPAAPPPVAPPPPSAADAPAPVAALVLEAGKPVDIVCDSKSVVVATNAANATSGSFRLKLVLSDDKAGAWTPLSVDVSHAGSLATLHAKACASGCPLVYEKGGDMQLWAPAPKGVDKLAPDELLLLAVLKTATLDFKASTFRGQQIEALESGRCRPAPPTVGSVGTPPPETR